MSLTVTFDRETAKEALRALEFNRHAALVRIQEAAQLMQGRPAGDRYRQSALQRAQYWTERRYQMEAACSALEVALWSSLPHTYLTRRWEGSLNAAEDSSPIQAPRPGREPR